METQGEKTIKYVITRLHEVLKDGVENAGEMFEEDSKGWHQLSLTWTDKEAQNDA